MNKSNVFESLTRKTISKEQLREIFDKYDQNHDQHLDEKELTSLLSDIYVQSVYSDPSIKNIQEEIKFLDTPKGQELISVAVKELLTLRDTNHNGKLEWEEFCNNVFSEESSNRFKERFWRLAPLIDVKVEDLKEIEKKDPYIRYKLFFCGALASSSARSFSAPLSRITILQQTQEFRSAHNTNVKTMTNIQVAKFIYETEGLKGFFRGNLADVLRAIPSGGLTYTTYELLKRFLLPYSRTENGTDVRMLSGGCAGLITSFSVYPVDVVRTRLAVQVKGDNKYNGIRDTFKKIFREEGFRAFYRGCTVNLFQIFPTMAINYTVFDLTKAKLKKHGYTGLLPSVFSGFVAGAIGSTLTFPMDVIIRNLQLDGKGDTFKGPFGVVKKVYQHQGIQGFFRGYIPMLLKVLPSCSVSYGVYDTCTRFLGIKLS